MKKIFVGNLDFGATEDLLRSLFEPYGSVESVHLVTDRETGRSRGFAFVEMAEGDADKAIVALNGTKFGGRPQCERGAAEAGAHRGRFSRGPRWRTRPASRAPLVI